MNIGITLVIPTGICLLVIWWVYGREKIGYSSINPLLKKYSYIPYEIKILWTIRICIFILIGSLWLDLHMMKKYWVNISLSKNIIFALDISQSMKADDISPSRIDKAKEVLIGFLSRPGIDAIGFTIFAGRTFVLSPPTYDHISLQSLIRETTTDTIDQSQADTSGSNIGDAIIASMEA
jgi:hypothetical protein